MSSSAAISPDGRWVAYTSDESGTMEVYVRPFNPTPGRIGDSFSKVVVSAGGGLNPVWSRTTHELFYTGSSERLMMAASFTAAGDAFSAGKPRRWMEQSISPAASRAANFDVAPDGKRILAFPAPERAEESRENLHLTFLLNFFDELKRRMP